VKLKKTREIEVASRLAGKKVFKQKEKETLFSSDEEEMGVEDIRKCLKLIGAL